MATQMKKQPCIMSKLGKCRSDYNYGYECDGINLPKNCPYSKERIKEWNRISNSLQEEKK